jgi:hypothetical protein
LQTTKRILLIPKREFYLGLSELEQKKQITLPSGETIPRGTLMSSALSLRLDETFTHVPSNNDSYLPALQVYSSWFIKVPGGTNFLHTCTKL